MRDSSENPFEALCRKKIVTNSLTDPDSYRDFGGHAQPIQHLLKNKTMTEKRK
jgi:hypothetical protein